jgi:hypothetical protein
MSARLCYTSRHQTAVPADTLHGKRLSHGNCGLQISCVLMFFTLGYGSGTSVGTFLTVRLTKRPLVFTTAPFTFWESPSMTSAVFAQTALSITVQFSTDTNRANMPPLSTDCSAIFPEAVVQTLGIFTVRILFSPSLFCP